MSNQKQASTKHHYLTSNQEDTFKQRVIHESTLASNNYRAAGFHLENAKQATAEGLTALGANNGLESMLAAQMLSIHQLQQSSMAFANAIDHLPTKQYYTNTAIKLSKCFAQQAGVLAKLQGIGTQKIVVERVDVHPGGQAIVGNVQKTTRQ